MVSQILSISVCRPIPKQYFHMDVWETYCLNLPAFVSFYRSTLLQVYPTKVFQSQISFL